jgi:hypothetical protein
MGSAERSEFRQTLLGIVEDLPERQRLVARIFIDHFEEFSPRDIYHRLAALVSDFTGRDEQVEAIKSLWHLARKRIGAELTRQGYAFQQGGRS